MKTILATTTLVAVLAIALFGISNSGVILSGCYLVNR